MKAPQDWRGFVPPERFRFGQALVEAAAVVLVAILACCTTGAPS